MEVGKADVKPPSEATRRESAALARRATLLRRMQAAKNDITTTSEEAAVRLEIWEARWEEFSKIQVRIDGEQGQREISLEETQTEEEIASAAEDMYVKRKASLMAAVRGMAASVETRSVDSISLPRIALPQFDGDRTAWESFRDRFSDLVIRRRELAGSAKLEYLMSCLHGQAQEAVRHLQVTDANFAVAWSTLVDRYNDNALILERL